MSAKKKELSQYDAVMICEGASGYEDADEETQLRAWSYLIRTGLCWNLQGYFGRMAQLLIESNTISKSGEILV